MKKRKHPKISDKPTKEDLYTGKSTSLLKEKRISDVVEFILVGYSRRDIILSLTRRYGVEDSTVYGYIKQAEKIIQDEYTSQRSFEIAKHVARRERWLKQVGRKKGNSLWVALAIDDSLIKLKGLIDNKLSTAFSTDEIEVLRKTAQELSKEMI